MREHHHTREVRFTLLPGTKYEISFTNKHTLIIDRGHVTIYTILPR